jgi:hypothetical protein
LNDASAQGTDRSKQPNSFIEKGHFVDFGFLTEVSHSQTNIMESVSQKQSHTNSDSAVTVHLLHVFLNSHYTIKLF